MVLLNHKEKEKKHMTQITNYDELFNNVFTKMDVIIDELPEFWYEEPQHLIEESEYFQERMVNDYKENNNVTQEEAEEFYGSDEFSGYAFDWIMDYLDAYVIYKVEGKDLDKLPEYIPVYWVDELNSYIFLQGWYGMASFMIKVKPFEWGV